MASPSRSSAWSSSTSHTLNALPIELLVFVINELDCVEDIAALALTNRRLYGTANPLLYRRAARCCDGRPVAWAANHGLVSTLRMALAAGCDPNQEFYEELPAEEWKRASAASRADAVAGRPKAPWGMWDWRRGPTVACRRWSPGPGADVDHADSPASVSTIGPSVQAPPSTSDLDSVVSSEDDPDLSHRSDASSATEPSPPPIPDTVDRSYTAMHLAARGGHDEVLKMLLSRGAAINVRSRHFCACTPQYGLLNALESPDESAEDPRWTPLHIAICHSHTDTAKLLLARDASVMMETTNHGTGSDAEDEGGAYRSGGTDDGGYGSTALHHAAGMGLTDLVCHILDNKIQADVNAQDDRTTTPFYHAYANRRWDSTVPLLLSRGADIHCETKMYIPYTAITPLGEACRLGDFDVADRLLDFGADPRRGFIALMKGGCLTPLHMCCMRSAQPVGQPVEKGDDDEARGLARGRTIHKLIARGAALDARDCFGDTPQSAAEKAKNAFALEALARLSISGGEHEGDKAEFVGREGEGTNADTRDASSKPNIDVVGKPVTTAARSGL
ncbi:ankyrin repeat-containing domain protein [Corynascus similis CBS 632.67]